MYRCFLRHLCGVSLKRLILCRYSRHRRFEISPKLLILSSEFPPGPGGIGTHAYQTAKNLQRLGWEVFVLSKQDYVSPEAILRFNKNQTFFIATWKQISFIPEKFIYRWMATYRFIRKTRPDLILASGDRDIYLAVLLSKLFNTPIVAIEHGRIPSKWERSVKRWALKHANSVIAVSQYTNQKMWEYGIFSKPSHVILNGADPDQFLVSPSAQTRELVAKAASAAKNILLTVGSVSERKGQSQVIKALPRILEKVPDTHYFIAGFPHKERELSQLALELGVAKYVHFLGAVSESELVSWLNACDVFLMTSRHTEDQFEGFGIAVIEAALCGKPAIVNRNSGLSEAIVDGVTGISVKEDDVSATADAVVELLTDEEKRVAMGKAAKERALKEFTWPEKMKEYDRYLRTFLPK